jgi:hypothetical protein
MAVCCGDFFLERFLSFQSLCSDKKTQVCKALIIPEKSNARRKKSTLIILVKIDLFAFKGPLLRGISF